MSFQITVIGGPDEGRTFSLADESVIALGRGEDVDFQLNDAGASRTQCRIQASGNRVMVEDAKSAGGTFVNGHPVYKRELQIGDVIEFASTKIRLQSAVTRDDETIKILAAPAQSAPAAPMAPPVVLNVQGFSQPPDVAREFAADLREQREGRQEMRGYYREDRASNVVGTIGMALGATTLLVAVSAILFREDLPFFRVGVGCFGLPVAVAALTCSIVGCMRTDRRRTLAFIGLAINILLILLILPTMFIS